jgi:hypothetical protein
MAKMPTYEELKQRVQELEKIAGEHGKGLYGRKRDHSQQLGRACYPSGH